LAEDAAEVALVDRSSPVLDTAPRVASHSKCSRVLAAAVQSVVRTLWGPGAIRYRVGQRVPDPADER
jgi:hypothetical protein